MKISKFETIDVYASDGEFNATKTLRIRVNDVNDNLPVFTKTLSLINISEAAETGTLMGEFCAEDLDSSDERLDFQVVSNSFQESYELTEVKL